MKSGRIFLSCILIIFGILLLLNNFNVIHFSFYDLKIWIPWVIILFGITMIPMNSKTKSIILIVIAALSFISIYFFYYKNSNALSKVRTSRFPFLGHSYYYYNDHDNDETYEFDDETYEFDDDDWEYYGDDDSLNDNDYDNNRENENEDDDIDKDDNGINKAGVHKDGINMCEDYDTKIETVSFNMNCALDSYYLSASNDSTKLLCFNNTNKKLMYSLLSKGSVNKKLELKLNNKKEKIKKEVRNQKDSKLDVKLHKNPVWDIDIESAAADLYLNLKDIKVRNLDLSGVTSDFDLTLGDLEENVEVDISSVMADLKINIPKDAYCVIEASTIMNNKSFENFVKKDKGEYVLNESNKDNASCKIFIDLSSTMSDVVVKLY